MSDLRPRRRPSRAIRRRRLVVAVGGAVVVVLAVVAGITAFALNAREATLNATDASPTPGDTPPTPTETTPTAPVVPSTAAGFDKSAHSTTDPASPWFIVNKIHPIPDAAHFVPALADIPSSIPNPNGHSLHPDAVAALVQMSQAASAEVGQTLIAQSGYRSYSTQVAAFDHYVNLLGVEGAEKTSARPGFSEHQTGYALDICTKNACDLETPSFGDTIGGKWLAENSWRFGFILRYPADKVDVTGYEYEPWHFRYVGTDLSTEMHKEGVRTLEEFFGVPGSTQYQQ